MLYLGDYFGLCAGYIGITYVFWDIASAVVV